jgi:hypothetical protein
MKVSPLEFVAGHLSLSSHYLRNHFRKFTWLIQQMKNDYLGYMSCKFRTDFTSHIRRALLSEFFANLIGAQHLGFIAYSRRDPNVPKFVPSPRSTSFPVIPADRIAQIFP